MQVSEQGCYSTSRYVHLQCTTIAASKTREFTMHALIIKIYTWYQLHRLKRLGARTVLVSPEKPYDLTSVLVRSVRGYALSFYCQKIVYTFEYENSLHHQKNVVYRLYAESHDDSMPPKLKEVLSHEVYLPRLFSDRKSVV